MKYNNFMKKLAAGVTVVAMLASLGMTAFAADVAEETYANEGTALTITSVDAYYTESGETKNYTVTVNYEGASAGDQVTVLGYLFDAENGYDPTATPAPGSIYAVNQEDAGKGSTEIKLSSAGTRPVEEGKDVLIIKMGSDAAGITAAKAVRIDLSKAERKQADLIVNADPVAVEAAVSYGAGKADLMGQLPDVVTVVGTRDEVQDDTGANVNVVWNVDDAWVANNMNGMTVTGTLQETTGVVLGSYNSVTANVTVNPLTTADVVAPAAVEVVVGADAAAIAAKVKTVTVKSGEITDTYTVSAENVTGFDTAAEGSTTATIAISGKSANGIFDLAEMTTTVDITVVEKPAVIYGDVNGDEAVNMQDVVLALQGYMEKAVLDDKQNLAADVNGDKAVNMQDVVLILQKYMEKITSFPVEQ